MKNIVDNDIKSVSKESVYAENMAVKYPELLESENYRNINYLFHFTPIKNLLNILKKGLIPRVLLDEYRETDQNRYEHCINAVCVSIGYPNYKMLERKINDLYSNNNWAIIRLKKEVLLNYRTAFTYTNAARVYRQLIKQNKMIKSLEELSSIRAFDFLFEECPILKKTRKDLNLPAYCTTDPQAEVLVFGSIRPEYIDGFELYNREKAFKEYPELNDYKDLLIIPEKSSSYFYSRENNINIWRQEGQSIYDYYPDWLSSKYKVFLNTDKTLKHLNLLARQGNPHALCALGKYYEEGIGGVEKSDKKAFEYYLQAAEQGDKEAQCKVSLLYEKRIGVEKSDKNPSYEKGTAQEYGNNQNEVESSAQTEFDVVRREATSELEKNASLQINIKEWLALLDGYKKEFEARWEKESFRLKQVKCFQDNWNLNANDMETMLEESLKEVPSIKDIKSYLMMLCKYDTDKVRQAFLQLYDEDETKTISEKIARFLLLLNSIFESFEEDEKIKWNKRKYKFSLYKISIFLWLKFPEKYCVFLESNVANLSYALNLGVKLKSGENLKNLEISEEIYNTVCNALSKDNELMSLFQRKLSADYTLYNDEAMNILALSFGTYLRETYSRNKISFWKIREGDTYFSNEIRKQLKNDKVVALHYDSEKKTDMYYNFVGMTTGGIKPGDYFYLCHANEIQLLGRFLDDTIEQSPYKDDLMQRKYEIIKDTTDDVPYTEDRKAWTPNGRISCAKVPEYELDMFEKLILQPYFDCKVKELLNQ